MNFEKLLDGYMYMISLNSEDCLAQENFTMADLFH
jgi:hypothetical protein